MELRTFLKNFLKRIKSRLLNTKQSKTSEKQLFNKTSKVREEEPDIPKSHPAFDIPPEELFKGCVTKREFVELSGGLKVEKVSVDVTKSLIIEDDIDKILDFVALGDNELKDRVFKALEEPIADKSDRALYFITKNENNETVYLVIFKVNTQEPKGLRMVSSTNKHIISLYIEYYTETSYEEALKTFEEGESEEK